MTNLDALPTPAELAAELVTHTIDLRTSRAQPEEYRKRDR